MALPHIGIDLGTTNTVMAACQKKDSDISVVILPIHQYDKSWGYSWSEKYLPSVLYFGNGVIVGEHAKKLKRRMASKFLTEKKSVLREFSMRFFFFNNNDNTKKLLKTLFPGTFS